MKAIIFAIFLFFFSFEQEFNENEVYKEVGILIWYYFVDTYLIGCGFAVRIGHTETSYNLHSHSINYGTGSGQQIVSTIHDANDPNSLWLFKEPFGERPCITGKRIACGQRVRLEHVISKKNLHIDKGFKAPFSDNQEVSLFGYEGNGDGDDDWIIDCENVAQDFVKGSTSFSLRHAETGKYLYTDNKNSFNNNNCRGCPIIGQREVSAVGTKSSYCTWKIVGVSA